MFRFLVLVLALSAVAYGENNVSSEEIQEPVEDVPTYTQEEAQAIADAFERIVGGSSAKITDVPWQVSLRVSNSHICGASLISASWAVTAAHCTSGRSASSLSLRAGSANRNSGGQTRSVSTLINHPSYNSRTTDNDIALLKVSSAFSLSNSIKAVGLPSQGAGVSTGTMALVSGWGTTTEGASSVPAELRQVWVPIVAQNSCNSLYGGSITGNMLCAGYTQGGKDACQGDSGGPLVISNRLVGVVSWGRGCARKNYPGVYARVATYRNWIKTNTGV